MGQDNSIPGILVIQVLDVDIIRIAKVRNKDILSIKSIK